ncbi:MAG: DUF4350 domain-containing protein [Gemmatimonadaceae bacterium]
MSEAPNRNSALVTTPASASLLPIRVLSAVAVLLVLFVIFAPQQSSDPGAMYSSYVTGAGGTRAIYDVLKRLGFSVERNEKPLSTEPDSNSTYLLFNPAQPLTATEQSHLLAAVRRGTILVFTMDCDALADSLGFETTTPLDGFFTLSRTHVAGGNPKPPTVQDPRAIFQAAFPISITVASTSKESSQTFLWLEPAEGSKRAQLDSAQQSALVIGHRVGRGYAIAVAPAQIVINQAVREPRSAIAIVRAIQFADTLAWQQPGSRKIVFDEYHHGFGKHADMVAAIERGLTQTPLGRVTLELVAAALILLLAFAVRPLAPVSVPPVSRRSPLEHVGALAYAYSQVNAKALGTRRLIHGLRRRHPFGLPRSLPDSEYMSTIRTRVPTVEGDVDEVLAAFSNSVPESTGSFADTGTAIANIERAIQK